MSALVPQDFRCPSSSAQPLFLCSISRAQWLPGLMTEGRDPMAEM